MSGSKVANKLTQPINWQVDTGPLGIPVDDLKQLEAATSGEHMIPLTADIIGSHLCRIVARIEDDLAGYTGIVSQYKFTDENGETHPAVELGGSIILPKFRGTGLGQHLYKKRLQVLYDSDEFPTGTRAVVFTNKNSRPHVEKGGFRRINTTEALSQEAFRLCESCNECPVGIQPVDDPTACCDYESIFVQEIKK